MASAPMAPAPLTLFSPLDSQSAAASTNGANGAPPTERDRWDEVRDTLLGLRALRDDWDGQGASTPESANVDSALAWVEQMRGQERALPPSRVAAGVAGEVYLVWQEPGLFLEAEISQPDQIDWLLAIDGKPARQWKTDRATLWLVGPVM